MQAAQKMIRYQKTFKEILANRALKGVSVRSLIYLHTIMDFGEVKHVSLHEMAEELGVSERAVVCRAIAELHQFGYIDKWKDGKELVVKLL